MGGNLRHGTAQVPVLQVPTRRHKLLRSEGRADIMSSLRFETATPWLHTILHYHKIKITKQNNAAVCAQTFAATEIE